jgi:hypothetical protein
MTLPQTAALLVLVVAALTPHLVLAGAGVDRLLVQIPGWYRIGPRAFATYARATDLANGLVVYPVLGISGPLFTWAALVVAVVQGAPRPVTVPLVAASVLCVLHSVATSQAAPTMLRVRHAGDEVGTIAPLLDRFVRISIVRAVLQVMAAVALLWALVAGW